MNCNVNTNFSIPNKPSLKLALFGVMKWNLKILQQPQKQGQIENKEVNLYFLLKSKL